MFWSRAKNTDPPKTSEPRIVAATPSAGPPSERPVDADAAIDAIGAMLRAMGKLAFDVEDLGAAEIGRRFEAWAQHVTIGGRHPSGEDRGRRDLAGMKRFFSEHRKREQAHVSSTVGELRQLVWTFVRSVHRAVADDHATDAKMKDQLGRLQVAATASSLEELKREALAAVSALDAALEEREERQRAQMATLGERLRALGRQLEEAKRESETDPLTKVSNRRAFDERVARVAELSALTGSPACLVLVDVDHFKAVNDAHGHPAGDQVLVRVADALSRAFLRGSDFVARYGGEEFAVVIPEATLASSRTLTQRVLASVRSLSLDDVAKGLKVTVSLGVAELAPGESAEAWVARADKALYEAKGTGRDRVCEAPKTLSAP